jgi:hypothetical protein
MMIGKVLAGWIGSSIDKSDGEGGTMGAVVGVATWEVAKRLVPAAIVIGIAGLGIHYVRQRLDQSAEG